MPRRDSRLIAFARENRQRDDLTARLVWAKLRGRRMLGQKWRREHPIGPYIADFYCAEARLALELDGDTHSSQLAYDESRDSYFRDLGIEVIRVHTFELVAEWDSVMDHIVEAAQMRIGRALD